MGSSEEKGKGEKLVTARRGCESEQKVEAAFLSREAALPLPQRLCEDDAILRRKRGEFFGGRKPHKPMNSSSPNT